MMFKRYAGGTVLAALLVLCALLSCASAEVTDNGLNYNINGDSVAITGYDGTEETLVIPATIDGLPVTDVILMPTEGQNTVTTKVVLPETVVRLGVDSFGGMTALTAVDGLAYVQELGGYNFSATQVKEMLFSDALRYAGPQAFECEALTTLRIPDDLEFDTDFTSTSIFRYNIALSSIELITTGNTPTLVKDGPALYTADMKTLIIYPCGYKGNLSYRIPEGVEEMATNAFDIRSAYVTDGLMDVVVPASVKKVYENTFYTGLYVVGDGSGTAEHFVMPHLHVYEDSVIAGYCQSMGYTYFLRDEETVTIDERVAQIVAESTADSMSDYEKAYALNQWLVSNVVYDNTLTHYTADSILFEGTGVCQSFMLTYELLLDAVGIPSSQYHVAVDEVGHGFNAVYLNGEWCYVDTTWNNNSASDCYFGMNVDMVGETYGLQNGFDLSGVGNNDGYQNYHPYRRGVYDEYLAQGVALVQEAVDSYQTELQVTTADLQALREAYLTDAARDLYFDGALLAAYLRDQSFGDEVYLSVKYVAESNEIAIYISYGEPLPEDYLFSKFGEGMRIDRYVGSDTVVTIPDEILGLPVVAIGSNAFENCTAVTSISMPDTIASIGDYAFFLCESLTTIELSDGLTYLGTAALGDCYALENIVLPEGLTSVGDNLFFQCTSLKNVTLPESLPNAGVGMFISCESLEKVTLPQGMTEIPNDLFSGCDSLKEVAIPAGVTRIGENAFVSTGLTSLTLPEGLTYIGEYAFLGCDLEMLTLPSTVREIAPHAFREGQLKSITLNEGLETIGQEAFYGAKLESIAIPASVTELGAGCFDGCSRLTAITVAEGSTSYCAVGNILYSADMSVLKFSPVTTSGTVRIPASVREIETGAFRDNTLVTGLVFEGATTTLGEYCFAGCTGLTQVSLPEGVTELPFACFLACSSLTKVTLPDTLVTIGDWAMLDCSSLTSIDLPDGVTSIQPNSLPRSLTTFRIPAAMPTLPDNTLSGSAVGSLYVHPGVTYIGLNNLPSDPFMVYGAAGSYAQTYAEANGFTFAAVSYAELLPNCFALPAELTVIEASAFVNTAVQRVVIADGCVSIGEGAFASSDALQYAHIPASVTGIGANAFDAQVVLIVPEGSYAESWGAENGYTVITE